MLARGGWINTTFGNLELMSNRDARWFARVQSLYLHFQSEGRIHTFGGIPGDIEPYGFGGVTTRGSVYVVMNPGQTMATLALPQLAPNQPARGAGRLQFRDAGFMPRLNGNQIMLGPGQMAMVGYGAYAAPAFDFGVQDDVVIPASIEPIPADFHTTSPSTIEATIQPPSRGVLRVIMRERTPDGYIRRTWAGGPPNGENMAKVFSIEATQDGHTVPVHIDYDKIVWSGLSWAMGEIKAADLAPDKPVLVRFHSTEKDPVKLDGAAYQVVY
jgi:hypothetical protein